MWGHSRHHPASISWHDFKNYETALKFYNEVKPIRGSNPPIRPVGSNRRYKQCSIEMADERLQFKLYDNIVMTYAKDGTVAFNCCGWPSVTTAKFLDAVLPATLGTVYRKNNKVILTVPRPDKSLNYEIPRNGWVYFKADKEWTTLEPLNAPVKYEYVANRKALNAVRRAYSDFINYLKVTAAISDVYSSDELIEYFPQVGARFVSNMLIDIENKANSQWSVNPIWVMRLSIQQMFQTQHTLLPSMRIVMRAKEEDKEDASYNLNNALNLAQSSKPDDWRKLTVLLAASVAASYRVDTSTSTKHDLLATFVGDGYYKTPELRSSVPASTLLKVFDEVLKIAYADVCFVSKEVETGVLPSERNTCYVYTYQYLRDNLTRRQNVRI